ncbi:MAG: S53 family peptidase [Terriglobales bacterium]|jgi:subtilase family serine protease
MRRRLTGFFILLLLSLATLLLPASLAAQVHDRIAQPLQFSQSQPVRGSVHPFARTEHDQGAAAGSMMLNRMVMTFSHSAAQQADLDAILSEQQNPLSPYYHQWFSPEQFADRFALSASDIAKVMDWLQGQGFSVDETARSRSYVAFTGTAAQVEAAFGTPIHHYLVNGELHYANLSDPRLPWPLASVVTGIHGLNDFRPKPRSVGRTSPRPEFTSSLSGNHYLAPDDFATIYNLHALWGSGIDGTGQKIAIMGQTDLILSDIATFRSVSGLPANVPTVVLVPGSRDPGVVSGDIVEANLDVQWAGAVAPKATIIYVNSNNGVFDSMNYAISQNLAPVISISYGGCELLDFTPSDINTLVAWGQQANAQGQTIVGPSGDSGAADCDYPLNANTPLKSATNGLAVDVPAALPYVTGVGGTTFNEGAGTFWNLTNNASNGSALSYIPEIAWNDTAYEIANGYSLAATGGGVSKLFAKPSWQTGVGVPADGQRDVPDISFAASFDHDGYLMCSQGSCVNGYRMANDNLFVVGGTSAGVPTFAAIVALINQKLGGTQGNVNPRLYQLAGTSTDAFHDITIGDNRVPCIAGTTDCPAGTSSIGYSAGVGYDLVTGLGSVNACNLVMEWNGAQPDFTVAAVTGTANVVQGATAQYSITVTSANGFVGAVSLAVTGLPAGATPAFNPNPVSITCAAAQSSVLQVTTTSSTAVGTYPLTVTAVEGGLTHTVPLSLTVTSATPPDFQASVSPTSLSLIAGTTANVGTSTLTISALNGFTGPVSLTCTVASLPGTTCSVSPASLTNSGTATVTVTAPTTRTVDLRAPKLFPHFLPWTDGSFAIAMGLMLVGKRERTSKKTKMAILAVMLIIAIAIMIGCGGGSSTTSSGGTPVTGTGTVTVTATSGALSHATTITVTVN